MRVHDSIHTDDFPLSYYADSLADQTDFEQLAGDLAVDVAIVGGGFTGVASALFLAEKGYSVALLEQFRIGWGASGRNGGQVIGGFSAIDIAETDKMEKMFGAEAVDQVFAMGTESVCLIRRNVNTYNIDCDLKWGYVDAAMSRRELDVLKADHDRLMARGYPHHLQLVDGEDMAGVIGGGRFIGGLVNSGSGHVHPLNLVRGEARAAQSLGARIFERAEVTEIKEDKEHVTLVTQNGSVTATQVILAGNAYLGDLVKPLGKRIIPVGSYIVATEPLTDAEVAATLPGDHAVSDMRWVLDYFRLSADKRLLFGGLANYGGRHPRNIAKVIQPRLAKVFPHLKDKPISHQWGGHIGISLNRVPQIGRHRDRIFYAQGYSGHGVAPTHLAAKILSEAVAGQMERFDIFARIEHNVFPGGPFRHQLLALGMLWYRLKDMIS